MAFQTLVVNDKTGVELSYIDSGVPPNATSYTTVFAVHGMIFTNLIFEKIMALAPSRNVRVVAINRRPFPGSTPFTPAELNITLTGGAGDAERDAQIEARGHEIGMFIARFITKFNLPPPSDGPPVPALYGADVGALFPRMKRAFLCGDRTAAFGINGMWAVKVDQALHGPEAKIVYKMMRGTNHFGHWDDAEKTMDVLVELS
ncbi:hypothetical protein C8R44DRAFT_991416 [Mycena epipterygia]|nr:hypothetical protein C8R44DRAFT_991416 [Mycena epipterygia]